MAVLSLAELKDIKGQDAVEVALDKLAAVNFAAYGYIHFLHLLTPQYTAHKALDEFYSELPGVWDGIAETYLSLEHRDLKYYNIKLSGTGIDVCDTLLQYAQELHDLLSKMKSNDRNSVINELEGYMSFVSSVRYKLTRLS